MCELLVAVSGRQSDDPYIDARCFKRGDVIVAVPDGWNWSASERSNSEWVIVKVPGVDVSSLSALTALEPDSGEPHLPSPVLQMRAFKLDLDRLPSAPTLEVLMACKLRKQPLPDPAVL